MFRKSRNSVNRRLLCDCIPGSLMVIIGLRPVCSFQGQRLISGKTLEKQEGTGPQHQNTCVKAQGASES